MRILVVEDEIKVLNFIRKGLQENAYTVDAASEGEEGLFLAEENEYDCIVLDIMLPKVDGYQIVRALRSKRIKTPVIFLTDQFLASSYATVDKFDLSKVVIDRGDLYKGNSPDYKRHAITESGISPRAFPGMSRALAVTDSDAHDEAGHPIEGAEIRNKMVEKLLRKIKGIDQEVLAPWYYGEEMPENLLIGWGSSCGPIKETVDTLRVEGFNIGMMNLNHLCPFPREMVAKAMKQAKKSIVIEGNATGQLARLIRTETGMEPDGKVLRYDGRPFTPAYIVEALKKEGL